MKLPKGKVANTYMEEAAVNIDYRLSLGKPTNRHQRRFLAAYTKALAKRK